MQHMERAQARISKIKKNTKTFPPRIVGKNVALSV